MLDSDVELLCLMSIVTLCDKPYADHSFRLCLWMRRHILKTGTGFSSCTTWDCRLTTSAQHGDFCFVFYLFLTDWPLVDVFRCKTHVRDKVVAREGMSKNKKGRRNTKKKMGWATSQRDKRCDDRPQSPLSAYQFIIECSILLRKGLRTLCRVHVCVSEDVERKRKIYEFVEQVIRQRNETFADDYASLDDDAHRFSRFIQIICKKN